MWGKLQFEIFSFGLGVVGVVVVVEGGGGLQVNFHEGVKAKASQKEINGPI